MKKDNRLNLYLGSLNAQYIKENAKDKGISMSSYVNLVISDLRKRMI